jgi:hypothetical protein
MIRDSAGRLLRMLAADDNGKPSERVFVLGGEHEHRVNLPAQQSRAINLAWALDERRKLHGRRVVVVGAGVAGATFAAAAARRGAHIALIDEHEEPITVQRAADQRYLHPNLFDWPNAGWQCETADLPVLNWRAEVASDVRNQLVAGFALSASSLYSGSMRWLPQRVVVCVKALETGVRVVYVALRDFCAGDIVAPGYRLTADIVVTAPGFLPEKGITGSISGSYWKDDRLCELTKPGVLIVGDGDGALTELLRVALKGAMNAPLWHQQQLPDLVSGVGDQLRLRLLDIEARMRDDLRAGSRAALTSDEPTMGALDSILRAHVRDRRVELVARKPLLKANAFLINRFLAARLSNVRSDAVTLTERRKRIRSDGIAALARGRDVIWRIGPPHEPPLVVPFFRLREIVAAIGRSKLLRGRAGLVSDALDETRTPCWTDDRAPWSRHLRSAAILATLDDLRPPGDDPDRPRLSASALLRMDLYGRRGGHSRSVWADHTMKVKSPSNKPAGRDDAERIVSTAARLVRLAHALRPAMRSWWWLKLADGVPYLSLDLLGIATDLAPKLVAATIAAGETPGLALGDACPRGARLPRTWVRVERVAAPGASTPADLADDLAVIKAPPTWERFRRGRSGVGAAAPLLRATSQDRQIAGKAATIIKQLRLALPSDATIEDVVEVAEGLTRSWPPPRELILALLAELGRAGSDRERSGALAADLFTRAIASQVAAILRPALFVFGQLVGLERRNAPLFSWVCANLIGESKEANPVAVGRALMLTSVAEFRPFASGSPRETPRVKIPLAASHLRDAMRFSPRAAADFAPDILREVAQIRSRDADVQRLADQLLARRADEPYVNIDLSYAGLIVSGARR